MGKVIYGNSYNARKKATYDQRARERQRTLTAGKSFYAPFKVQYKTGERDSFPEGKAVYYASLCIEAGLELNPSIRPLYIEIIRSLNSPRIKEYRSELQAAQSLKALQNINFLSCIEHPDFLYFQRCVSKFILHGFNHRSCIEDNPKITAGKSHYLALAVAVGSAIEYEESSFGQLDNKLQGDNYRVMQERRDNITNRQDQERRKRLHIIAKKYDLHLIHEDGLYELAKLWYVARVVKDNLTVASQIQEYNGYALPAFSNPGTAYHKIHDFDIATGYDA